MFEMSFCFRQCQSSNEDQRYCFCDFMLWLAYLLAIMMTLYFCTANIIGVLQIRLWKYAVTVTCTNRDGQLRYVGGLLTHLKPWLQLRFDYYTTTTRLRRKIDVHFLLASNRVEWKQARAIRRSRIVVVSQSNRTHIVISITSVVVECVLVSLYRTYIVVESQLWYRL